MGIFKHIHYPFQIRDLQGDSMLKSLFKLRAFSFPGIIMLMILSGCSTGCSTPAEKPAESPVEKSAEAPSSAGTPEKPSAEETVKESVEKAEEAPTVAEQLSGLKSVDQGNDALTVLEDSEDLTIQERIVKASLQIAEEKLDEAEKTLSLLSRDDPDNPDILYTWALYYDAREEAAQRDSSLKKALSINPGHIDSLLFQGMVELGQRSYEKANRNFARILEKEGKNFLALSGAATAQMNLEKLEKSIELLDRAIALEPEFAYLYVDRARAWRGLKKYGKAEDDFTRAIELEPDVEWHYLDRARIRIQRFQDLEGAWEDLVKLDEINPDNFFANVFMAGILDDWKRYDEAEVYYEKVLAARPDYGFAHEPLAKIAYMDGRYEDAKTHFLLAYEFEPRDTPYILAASICMEKLGERKSAEKLLKEVAARLKRESVEYEMFRYYLSPGSDFFISDKIKKEENEDLKSRMYYYLGARYDLNGQRKSALAAYGYVNEKSEFYESDLAVWETGRSAD